MGPRGLQWESASPTQRKVQREMIAAQPARLRVPHLKAITRSWRSWLACKPVVADQYCTSVTHLGIFLQGEAAKGPTVAPSRLLSFQLSRTHIGLRWTRALAGHTPRQARALQPKDFWNIADVIRQQDSKLTVPAGLVLLSIVARICCQHFAHSCLQGCSPNMVIALCKRERDPERDATMGIFKKNRHHCGNSSRFVVDGEKPHEIQEGLSWVSRSLHDILQG